MKAITKSYRSVAKIAAVMLALSFSLHAYAESPREELVHAYRLLKKANNDYAGHRVKALAEVEAAGHELGLDLGGEIEEHERQWKSDAQLVEARRLVREARNKLEHADRDRVASHLTKAVDEIDEALHTK